MLQKQSPKEHTFIKPRKTFKRNRSYQNLSYKKPCKLFNDFVQPYKSFVLRQSYAR